MAIRKRPIQVKFRCTELEKTQIEKNFKESTLKNITDYLRRSVLDPNIVQKHAVDRKTFLELNRIGNNINQIADHLNSNKHTLKHKDLTDKLFMEIDTLKKQLSLVIHEISELNDK